MQRQYSPQLARFYPAQTPKTHIPICPPQTSASIDMVRPLCPANPPSLPPHHVHRSSSASRPPLSTSSPSASTPPCSPLSPRRRTISFKPQQLNIASSSPA